MKRNKRFFLRVLSAFSDKRVVLQWAENGDGVNSGPNFLINILFDSPVYVHYIPVFNRIEHA